MCYAAPWPSSKQDLILPGDLPATLVVQEVHSPDLSSQNDSLVAYEQSTVENALKKTNNNKRQAAQLLSISEATLYRKLKLFALAS